MEINKATFMHHAKMPAGHLVFIFIFVTRSHKKQCRILIPRDAPVGHRRGNNPVEYVFIFFIFIFVTRSHKKQCRILIEV